MRDSVSHTIHIFVLMLPLDFCLRLIVSLFSLDLISIFLTLYLVPEAIFVSIEKPCMYRVCV